MNLNIPNIRLSDLNDYLAQLVLSDLVTLIDQREKGHCLQVTDLPENLMELLCVNLRRERSESEIYVLSSNPNKTWQITSTKLIERRNAEESVIVVFLPPGLRTSAEDSFDISTFERFPIGKLFNRLRKLLFSELSPQIQNIVDNIIQNSECTNEADICRYLLAVRNQDEKSPVFGLALHHVGLIPDYKLLENLETLRPRLHRNLSSVKILESPNDALYTKIQRLELREGKTSSTLFHFFGKVTSFAPRIWLVEILSDDFREELTFDKWEFREKVTGDIDEIVFTNLGTSGMNDDGYPLFNISQDKTLRVAWETTPPPIRCDNLAYFTVEIMKDGVPVTEARKVQSGKSVAKTRRTAFKNLHQEDLDEGLYYLRVNEWTSSGQLLHSVDSESIFFSGGIEADEEYDIDASTKRQRQITVTSVYEALLRTQVSLRQKEKSLDDLFAGLASRNKKVDYSWYTPDRRAGGRYTDQFVIKYNSANQFILPINTILRRIEEETLSDADSLGRWELDLRQPVTAEIQPLLQPFEGIELDQLDEFLLIRKELFQKILNQPGYPGTRFLVETSNLEQWEKEIVQYSQAYRKILNYLIHQCESIEGEQLRNFLHANRQITTIDSIRLILPEGKHAYLLAPTHPLKIMWVLQYARVTSYWLEALENVPKSQINWNSFAEFLPRLSSLNIPHAITASNSELLVNAESFGPFWTIFVPLETDDTRALIGRIKTLLGSPESDDRFTTITGVDLARTVRRYLAQHPYITTLKFNAVQPSGGAILVDMLLELERTHPYLNYHIHLFSGDFHRGELGVALDELMSPAEKRSGREELDAFLSASQNALFPKLTYSKHTLLDLIKEPEKFESHITFLFDAFKVSVINSEPMQGPRSNHLYGLVNEYIEEFTSREGEVSWQRQMNPQIGIDLDDDNPVLEILVNSYQAYNKLISSISSSGNSLKSTPTINLALGPNDKNLVNQVHQVSDWVFTIDRNFGLDYLDNPYDKYCPAYLIDYQPEYLGDVGHRLIISTQQISEIERIILPVLARLNLPSEPSVARLLINALRSISGRLVLKLVSSPQMAHGALGMALARLFLESAELLRDMILIPLDTHIDLFETARKEAEILGKQLSLSRTDMLLVELEPESQIVNFHLVEVKFRQSGNLSESLTTKQKIEDQLEKSVSALRLLYDPNMSSPDRFDRLIRTRELESLLEFYLKRAVRYKLVDTDYSLVLQSFIETLEKGYTLRFTRNGVVFDFSSSGYETEQDGEVTYHYLGIERVGELISTGVEAETSSRPLSPDSSTPGHK